MATISGTIRSITNVSKPFAGAGSTTARDGREVYLVTCDFGVYEDSADTADLLAVGAAISARVRDGKTRTLRAAVPAFAGADANNQAVYFTGATVQALTVSSDDLTGELNDKALTELDTSGTTKGCGILVVVDAV